MMVKMDIEEACSVIIPVHPHDRPSGPENDSVPLPPSPFRGNSFPFEMDNFLTFRILNTVNSLNLCYTVNQKPIK